MINHISIQNFAIIENTEIDFEEGLNIITGETGSGKSIVIEAISLALGSRADSAFVRHGAQKAVVQLAGELYGEDIVITREVSAAGKNLCKLNGQLVTLGELSETCRRLADIHGQYDNQSLLNPDNHIKLVDSFHGEQITPIKEAYQVAYASYQDTKSRLTKLLSAEQDNLKKLDFYRFEQSEIENAHLTPGEDESLSERISILQNSEKIFDAIETAYGLLSDGDRDVLSSMGTGLHALQSISEYSKEIQTLTEEFADIYYRLEDLSSELRRIRDDVTFSPEELDDSITRISQIDGLKKKYGSTIEEILTYYDTISEELNQIENFDDVKAQLQAEADAAYKALSEKAAQLTEVRKASAKELETAIESELHDLNFGSAKLSIDFQCSETFGPDGNDDVEFLISTNKGEPLKPLVKIASGGEISRIMLAIKNITGTYDNIPTMIFDEIDAGISGITASIVGRKLHQIAKNHQIICITHLPQIAASGDTHYRIYKEENDSNTFTTVEKLSDTETIDEIARLLGGENITETTRKSAVELMELTKQKI
ncbi:MAG: DNA repair protein RecN [Emergencia sp.]|jgi:DNA repair protein RecN (Recombination protein N)|uniref:DNA repair protein RecN n=1 Tax=Emergencia sp. 1XD21-10 TaxID=2304569 RepID=UPI001379C318|nr:DNA repair protein RecN [Emergencia sp. 1XD21-10]MCI9475620.1 DNA repair protein RecN [Emergencia sp.]NCE98841.1 DNA repair protein RecN [Emergencia sp. 1XD21-10]